MRRKREYLKKIRLGCLILANVASLSYCYYDQKSSDKGFDVTCSEDVKNQLAFFEKDDAKLQLVALEVDGYSRTMVGYFGMNEDSLQFLPAFSNETINLSELTDTHQSVRIFYTDAQNVYNDILTDFNGLTWPQVENAKNNFQIEASCSTDEFLGAKQYFFVAPNYREGMYPVYMKARLNQKDSIEEVCFETSKNSSLSFHK